MRHFSADANDFRARFLFPCRSFESAPRRGRRSVDIVVRLNGFIILVSFDFLSANRFVCLLISVWRNHLVNSAGKGSGWEVFNFLLRLESLLLFVLLLLLLLLLLWFFSPFRVSSLKSDECRFSRWFCLLRPGPIVIRGRRTLCYQIGKWLSTLFIFICVSVVTRAALPKN